MTLEQKIEDKIQGILNQIDEQHLKLAVLEARRDAFYEALTMIQTERRESEKKTEV